MTEDATLRASHGTSVTADKRRSPSAKTGCLLCFHVKNYLSSPNCCTDTFLGRHPGGVTVGTPALIFKCTVMHRHLLIKLKHNYHGFDDLPCPSCTFREGRADPVGASKHTDTHRHMRHTGNAQLRSISWTPGPGGSPPFHLPRPQCPFPGCEVVLHRVQRSPPKQSRELCTASPCITTAHTYNYLKTERFTEQTHTDSFLVASTLCLVSLDLCPRHTIHNAAHAW